MVVKFRDFLRDTLNPFFLCQFQNLGIDFFVVLIVPDTKIKIGLSKVSHDIGNRTTFDRTKVKRNAAIPISEFFDRHNELDHGINRIATAFRIVAGMGRHTMESDAVSRRAFASANQFTTFSSRLKN